MYTGISAETFDIEVPDKWHEHQPEPMIEHQEATIL